MDALSVSEDNKQTSSGSSTISNDLTVVYEALGEKTKLNKEKSLHIDLSQLLISFSEHDKSSFECLICQKTMVKTEFNKHIKSQRHLIQIIKYRLDENSESLRNSLIDATKEEKLKVLESLSQGAKNELLNRGTKNESSRDLKSIPQPSTPKMLQNRFQAFGKIVIVGPQIYTDILKILGIPNQVRVVVVTENNCRSRIRSAMRFLPSKTLWLFFFGVHTNTLSKPWDVCEKKNCDDKLNFLQVKEVVEESARRIISAHEKLVSIIKSVIPNESEVILMPPIPIKVLDFACDLPHKELHTIVSNGVELSTVKDIEKLRQLYTFLHDDFLQMANCKDKSAISAHCLSLYFKEMGDTSLVSDSQDAYNIYEVWLSSVHRMLSTFISLSGKVHKIRSSPCNNKSPTLIRKSNLSPSTKNVNQSPITLNEGVNPTNNRIIFMGKLSLLKKIVTIEEKLANFTQWDFEFPLQWAHMERRIKSLPKSGKTVIFVLADPSIIGARLPHLFCITEKCQNSIVQNAFSCSNKPCATIDAILAKIKEQIDCTLILLPLYPISFIKVESVDVSCFHSILHCLCPAFAEIACGSEGEWNAAAETLKQEWSHLVKQYFSQSGLQNTFHSLLETESPLLYWREPNLLDFKIKTESETKWCDSFTDFLEKNSALIFNDRQVVASPPVLLNKNTAPNISHIEENKRPFQRINSIQSLVKINTGIRKMKDVILSSFSEVASSIAGSSYDKVYVLSDASLKKYCFPLPLKAEFISFNLNNCMQPCTVVTALKMKMKGTENAACVLVLSPSFITEKLSFANDVKCSNKSCKSDIEVCMLKLPGSVKFVQNQCNKVELCVKELSEHIPTFVMPLYPICIILCEPSSTIKHDISHVCNDNQLLAIGGESKWNTSVTSLNDHWNLLLEKIHKPYPIFSLVKRYIDSSRTIIAKGFSVSDFVSPFYERHIWKGFLNIFLLKLLTKAQSDDNNKAQPKTPAASLHKVSEPINIPAKEGPLNVTSEFKENANTDKMNDSNTSAMNLHCARDLSSTACATVVNFPKSSSIEKNNANRINGMNDTKTTNSTNTKVVEQMDVSTTIEKRLNEIRESYSTKSSDSTSTSVVEQSDASNSIERRNSSGSEQLSATQHRESTTSNADDKSEASNSSEEGETNRNEQCHVTQHSKSTIANVEQTNVSTTIEVQRSSGIGVFDSTNSSESINRSIDGQSDFSDSIERSGNIIEEHCVGQHSDSTSVADALDCFDVSHNSHKRAAISTGEHQASKNSKLSCNNDSTLHDTNNNSEAISSETIASESIPSEAIASEAISSEDIANKTIPSEDIASEVSQLRSQTVSVETNEKDDSITSKDTPAKLSDSNLITFKNHKYSKSIQVISSSNNFGSSQIGKNDHDSNIRKQCLVNIHLDEAATVSKSDSKESSSSKTSPCTPEKKSSNHLVAIGDASGNEKCLSSPANISPSELVFDSNTKLLHVSQPKLDSKTNHLDADIAINDKPKVGTISIISNEKLFENTDDNSPLIDTESKVDCVIAKSNKNGEKFDKIIIKSISSELACVKSILNRTTYKNIICIVDDSLSSSIIRLPFYVEIIFFDFSFKLKFSADDLINKMKDFSTNDSICFLIVSPTYITKDVNVYCTQPHNCSESVKGHSLKSSNPRLIENQAKKIFSLVSELSKSLPTLLLPLFPLVIFLSPSSHFDHQLLHQFEVDPFQALILATGVDSTWNNALSCLNALWLTELKKGYANHPSLGLVYKWCGGYRKIFTYGHTIDDYNTPWNQKSIWEAIVEAIISSYIKELSKTDQEKPRNTEAVILGPICSVNRTIGKTKHNLNESMDKICKSLDDKSTSKHKTFYVVGDKALSTLISYSPFNIGFIDFDLSDATEKDADLIIEKIKPFNEKNSICFLNFTASIITHIASYLDCREKCTSKIELWNLKSNEDNYVQNRIGQIKLLVQKLSAKIKTYILPLFPSSTFFYDANKGFDHNLAHLFPKFPPKNARLAYCNKATWNDAFIDLSTNWNALMKEIYASHLGLPLVEKFIEFSRPITIIGLSKRDFYTFWIEKDIWKCFVKHLIEVMSKEQIDLNSTSLDPSNSADKQDGNKNLKTTSKEKEKAEKPKPASNLFIPNVSNEQKKIESTAKVDNLCAKEIKASDDICSSVQLSTQLASFQSVFVIGDFNLLKALTFVTTKFKFIPFDLFTCDADTLLSRMGSFDYERSVCFFICAASIIGSKGSTNNLKCSKGCKHNIEVYNLRKGPQKTAVTVTIEKVRSLLKALSGKLSTFVLPIFPTTVYFCSPLSVLDHELLHLFCKPSENNWLAYGSEIKWRSSLLGLTKQWKSLLTENHEAFSSFQLISSYKDDVKGTHITGSSISDFECLWSETKIWRNIISNLLEVLIHNKAPSNTNSSQSFRPQISYQEIEVVDVDGHVIVSCNKTTSPVESQDKSSSEHTVPLPQAKSSPIIAQDNPSASQTPPSIESLNAITKDETELIIKTIQDSYNLIQSLNAEPIFDKVYFIGNKSTTNFVPELPFKSEYIHFDFNSDVSLDNIETLLGKLSAKPEENVACFLFFSSSIIGKKSESSLLKCSSRDCKMTIESVSLKSPNQDGISHLIQNISQFTSKLSEKIKTFILPLFPSIIFLHEKDSIVDHNLVHLFRSFPHKNAFLCVGKEEAWKEAFNTLSSKWNKLLCKNHLNQKSVFFIDRFLTFSRPIYATGFTTKDFFVLWNEKKVWESIIKFIVTILAYPLAPIALKRIKKLLSKITKQAKKTNAKTPDDSTKNLPSLSNVKTVPDKAKQMLVENVAPPTTVASQSPATRPVVNISSLAHSASQKNTSQDSLINNVFTSHKESLAKDSSSYIERQNEKCIEDNIMLVERLLILCSTIQKGWNKPKFEKVFVIGNKSFSLPLVSLPYKINFIDYDVNNLKTSEVPSVIKSLGSFDKATSICVLLISPHFVTYKCNDINIACSKNGCKEPIEILKCKSTGFERSCAKFQLNQLNLIIKTFCQSLPTLLLPLCPTVIFICDKSTIDHDLAHLFRRSRSTNCMLAFGNRKSWQRMLDAFGKQWNLLFKESHNLLPSMELVCEYFKSKRPFYEFGSTMNDFKCTWNENLVWKAFAENIFKVLIKMPNQVEGHQPIETSTRSNDLRSTAYHSQTPTKASSNQYNSDHSKYPHSRKTEHFAYDRSETSYLSERESQSRHSFIPPPRNLQIKNFSKEKSPSPTRSVSKRILPYSKSRRSRSRSLSPRRVKRPRISRSPSPSYESRSSRKRKYKERSSPCDSRHSSSKRRSRSCSPQESHRRSRRSDSSERSFRSSKRETSDHRRSRSPFYVKRGHRLPRSKKHCRDSEGSSSSHSSRSNLISPHKQKRISNSPSPSSSLGHSPASLRKPHSPAPSKRTSERMLDYPAKKILFNVENVLGANVAPIQPASNVNQNLDEQDANDSSLEIFLALQHLNELQSQHIPSPTPPIEPSTNLTSSPIPSNESTSTSGNVPSSAKTTEEDFNISNALNLLEELKSKLGLLGDAISTLASECRERGHDTPAALKHFQNEENEMLLKMIMEKLNSLLHTEQGSSRALLLKACDWTSKLLEICKKDAPFHDLDITSIAENTIGKDPAYIVKFIRTALICDGIQPSDQEIDNLFLEVCAKHFDL